MDNTFNNQQATQDLSVRAAKILADLKKASDNFMANTGALVSELNQGAAEAEVEVEEMDKDLSNVEKDVNDKMDQAILEYLSDEEKG
ncbi:MAG TPA: hypothetical protein PKZ02_01040 [Candidatus Paceibacterota bacterium]|nr:hypothetical protein [Candidatus Paceibacterota bacterium]HRY76661.1 hypothetical protein [Candidatus Paceibacterota bacterium]